MDAKALLQGMGWSEGQGLGKSNQGISKAIKPKVQLDRNGLGLNPAASLIEPWWAKVFNHTAKNVSVDEAASTTKVSKEKRSLDEEQTDEMTYREQKKERRKKKRSRKDVPPVEDARAKESNSVDAHIASISKSLYLGSFTRGTTLAPGHSFSESTESGDAVGVEKTVFDKQLLNPIDEDLRKSCNGRTAHKGARYGVLKGKMARLVRQEQAMAARMHDANS